MTRTTAVDNKTPILPPAAHRASRSINRLRVRVEDSVDKPVDNHEELKESPVAQCASCVHNQAIAELTEIRNSAQQKFFNILSTVSPYYLKEALSRAPDIETNAKNESGATLAHMFTLEGNYQKLASLLEHDNTNPNIKDDQFRVSPLHFAAAEGRPAIVKLLANHRHTNINSTDPHGATPLHYAAARGHLLMSKILTEHPNINLRQQDNAGRTAYDCAVAMGHHEVAKLLKPMSE